MVNHSIQIANIIIILRCWSFFLDSCVFFLQKTKRGRFIGLFFNRLHCCDYCTINFLVSWKPLAVTVTK